MKYFLLSIFIFFYLFVSSQSISVSGILVDTIAKEPLSNAIVMALRLNDSTLTKFCRSNADGVFTINALPIDTYQVVISHPKFSDLVYFIFGDSKNVDYNFGKIIMQAKNVSLDEVTIYAFKEPIYYKGDTLIYTADSFKTKANATVEDLLKKLPGIKVGLDGKITTQGKKVEKVLVDGDEFFGSDPTVATKNLNANAIESVQVYDKKTEGSSNETGEETQKIMNLVLKEDSKKGYFGKISGASDFQKFYEGEALGNYFKKKLKISVFGLASNTPRSSFGWDDIYKYGLDNESNYTIDDDDGSVSMFSMNNSNEGLPKTFKTGFYYTDKITKNTKLGFNFVNNTNQLISQSNTNSQYFLSDTSYSTNNEVKNVTKSQNNLFNFTLDQKIDSLTNLYIKSSLQKNETEQVSLDETNFVDKNNRVTRNTLVNNNAKTTNLNFKNTVSIIKKFKKKDRLLNVTYNQEYDDKQLKGLLNTKHNYDSSSALNLINVNQQKINQTINSINNISAVYTEPINNKFKFELSYDYSNLINKQNKQAFNNIGGEYTQLDSNFTNNFNSLKQVHKAGTKIIYEIKKIKFTLGTKVRNVDIKNKNLFLNQTISQNFNNVLPFSSMRYKFSENSQLSLTYKTNSTNPTINQLQPIPDNTNPNFIKIGNPNLLPTFAHNASLNYNTWKPLSGSYTWLGLSYNKDSKAFITRSYFDSIGRSVSQTVNINNGSENYSGYAGTSIPLFSKKISIDPSLNSSYYTYKNFINNELNTTKNFNLETTLQLGLELDNVSASISASNSYIRTESSLNQQSFKPYTKQDYNASLKLTFPKKLVLQTNAVYNVNSNRSDGYNINYLVWNGNLTKTLLKNENLLIGIYAYDILNQNVNVARNITANIITDSRTNIIARYFLLKVTYKFNSNKQKEDEEDY